MTKEQKQALSGKGKTRVQIAQATVDNLKAKLWAAEARLEKAIEDEKANAGKIAEKEKAAKERARKALIAAGFTDLAKQVK